MGDGWRVDEGRRQSSRGSELPRVFPHFALRPSKSGAGCGDQPRPRCLGQSAPIASACGSAPGGLQHMCQHSQILRAQSLSAAHPRVMRASTSLHNDAKYVRSSKSLMCMCAACRAIETRCPQLESMFRNGNPVARDRPHTAVDDLAAFEHEIALGAVMRQRPLQRLDRCSIVR